MVACFSEYLVTQTIKYSLDMHSFIVKLQIT